MNDWLNMRYFWICTALGGVLSVAKYTQGEKDLLQLILIPISIGVFWGVIVTFIAKRLKNRLSVKSFLCTDTYQNKP